mgnify:CR=1 FL=1
MQQFKFEVETNLCKADLSKDPILLATIPKNFQIPKELIKAVNLPDTTFSYDNDAANIGSGGPNIESQDPQVSELELQLYMTPELMQDLQDIFYTYYLQSVESTNENGQMIIVGAIPKILNKDRISYQPLIGLLKTSNILVKILDGAGNTTKVVNYYGVYPVSYSFGNLDYSSSDVVVGSMKFYFYGYEITSAEDAAAGKIGKGVIESLQLIRDRSKKLMGNY